MPKRATSKYYYECPFHSCHNNVSTDIGPVDYPTCDGAHTKLMDFIEARSKAVPSHITESKQKPTQPGAEDYKVNGGNWIGA